MIKKKPSDVKNFIRGKGLLAGSTQGQTPFHPQSSVLSAFSAVNIIATMAQNDSEASAIQACTNSSCILGI